MNSKIEKAAQGLSASRGGLNIPQIQTILSKNNVSYDLSWSRSQYSNSLKSLIKPQKSLSSLQRITSRSPRRMTSRSPQRLMNRSPRRITTRSPRRITTRSPRKTFNSPSYKNNTKSNSVTTKNNSSASITVQPSSRSGKKYMATVNGKTVHFGASGYEDFTIHQDENRKQRYINRHQARENWEKSGLKTAGFWSRWLLWNKPTIKGSARDIEKRFGVSIVVRS